MTGRVQGLLASAAFALYAAMGAAAFAQPGPPPGPGHNVMMRAPESAAERAGKLRDLLQLKPAQEPALQAFVGALDSARQAMGPPGGAPQAMPATTPERLARMQEMMARHQAAANAMIEATRRFYDQLDPAQKRAFDAMPPMMMMHHGLGGPMGGPGGGMGPRGVEGMGPPPGQ